MRCIARSRHATPSLLDESVRHAISVAGTIAAERKLVEDSMGATLNAVAHGWRREWQVLDCRRCNTGGATSRSWR